MKSLLIAALATLIATPLFAAESAKTWEGTWNNRKYGTSGPLRCVATPGEDGVWTATFTGTFQGDPFKYDVTFDSKKSGRNQELKGTAVIRGHDYEWIGQMRGNKLLGKYRASVGYYGEFQLTEVRSRR
ncbi:hypothetical protein Pan216_49960 [Planctomycetes bacterium Pan216]|uniref:DUF2147 domain-containing protein n=1 Tax=Kolteria novifilia TaxID=2527975 RepID=A0A518BAZ1_9BACT|nr:hypothetical protein Pan216_49960 [Planctomycetes bacterium Pan216]